MTQAMMILKSMFTRRWLPRTVLVLLLISVFISLGFWQLDRLAQRRAANAQRRAVLEGPPLQLSDETLPADLSTLEDRRVIVSGVYDLGRQGYLILQNWQGRSGVHLITPLQIAGSERAVLVDRGWIPDAEVANAAQFDVTGPVTVEGFVALTETLSRPAANASPVREEDEYYRVDVAAIGARLPYELVPFYVVAAPEVGAMEMLPLRRPREIDLSDGPHLSYALQWFIFASLTAVLYVVYVRRGVMQ